MTGLQRATDVPKEEAEARLKVGKVLAAESVSNTPLKRFGVPEDAANLVSFLASRYSDCEWGFHHLHTVQSATNGAPESLIALF